MQVTLLKKTYLIQISVVRLNHADIYGQFNNGRSGNWLRESKFCAPQQLTHLLTL